VIAQKQVARNLIQNLDTDGFYHTREEQKVPKTSLLLVHLWQDPDHGVQGGRRGNCKQEHLGSGSFRCEADRERRRISVRPYKRRRSGMTYPIRRVVVVSLSIRRCSSPRLAREGT
jgi:hypothetical protein